MDFTLKEVIIGLLGIGIYIFNYFKTRANKKKEIEAEQLQRESAALKLAEESKKQAEELAKKLKAELDIAAEKLASETARQLKEREEHETEEKKRLDHIRSIQVNEDVDRRVKHAENAIKYRYQAQRMYVIHFSNGTKTESGLHLYKITFKHEVVENFTVEPISKYFNEKPIPEMFNTPMRRTLRGEEYYLADIDTLDRNDPSCKLYRDWLEAYKIKSTLWVPLKNHSGNVVAILVIHWFAKTHLQDPDISKIRDMKSEIELIYNDLQKPITAPSGLTR